MTLHTSNAAHDREHDTFDHPLPVPVEIITDRGDVVTKLWDGERGEYVEEHER